MIQRAAIYCRVSTARQNTEDKVSMEDQEERCRAVCQSKGWEIVHIYDEGDASAGTAQRGEFQRMLADAKTGQFDVIVVREVSRLSRVAQARHAIEDLMVNWGLSVCNARSGMTYSESDGLGASLIWTVEAKMAEAELAERSFRTVMGMRGKAQRGIHPGGRAPYGYRWTGGEQSEIVVDEETAEVVREIFRCVAEGEKGAAVAAYLNVRGLPSPGNVPRGWYTQTINKIVRQTGYYGVYQYGRRQTKRLNSERDRRGWAQVYTARHGMPPNKIPSKIKVPGTEVQEVRLPPIVDEQTWHEANDRLTRTRKRRAVSRRPAILLGTLRCDECGQQMKATWGIGKGGNAYYFYRCTQHLIDKSRPPCRPTHREQGLSAYVPAEAIEGKLWQLIDAMLSDHRTLAAAVGATRTEEERSEPVQQDRLRRHELKLERAVRAWDIARRVHFAGDLDAATYSRDREYYEREISMLENEVRRMRQATGERNAQTAIKEQVALISERWPEIREAVTDDERRELLHALVDDVTISATNEVTVTGTLAPDWCSKTMDSGTGEGIRTPTSLGRGV